MWTTFLRYENVFQNPELFGTQVSLSPEQSTLVLEVTKKTAGHRPAKIAEKYSCVQTRLPAGPPLGSSGRSILATTTTTTTTSQKLDPRGILYQRDAGKNISFLRIMEYLGKKKVFSSRLSFQIETNFVSSSF
jgi:hypothetical protein